MNRERKPVPAAAETAAVAARLRITREVLGLRAVDICRATGISPSAYSNYESGRARPNLDDMIRYAEAFNISLDWIYRGELSALPNRMACAIIKANHRAAKEPPSK